jgi:hypothetical protein
MSENDSEAGIALNKLRERASRDAITAGALKSAMEVLLNEHLPSAPSRISPKELKSALEKIFRDVPSFSSADELGRRMEHLAAKDNELQRSRADLKRTAELLTAKEGELKHCHRRFVIIEDELQRTREWLVTRGVELNALQAKVAMLEAQTVPAGGEGAQRALCTVGAIMDWIADEFLREHDIELRNDRVAQLRLEQAAEQAREELTSSKEETDISLPFITADASGPKHLTMKLTRPKLESLIGVRLRPLVEQHISGGKHGKSRDSQLATKLRDRTLRLVDRLRDEMSGPEALGNYRRYHSTEAISLRDELKHRGLECIIPASRYRSPNTPSDIYDIMDELQHLASRL